MEIRSAAAFIRRWIVLLVLGPLVGGIAGYMVVSQIPPEYAASALLQIGQANPSGNSDLNAAQQLGRTYVEVIQTRPVLDEVATRVDPSLSATQLRQMITVTPVRDTSLLRITAEDTNPVRAAQLANTTASVFASKNAESQASRFASSRENLSRLVDSLRVDVETRNKEIDRLRAEPPSSARDADLTRLQGELAQLQSTYGATVRSYEDLRVTEARNANTVNLLEPAVAPETPARPNRFLTTVMAALGGLILAASVAGAAEYLDDGLRDRARVRRATSLVTLGLIPRDVLVPAVADPSNRRFPEAYRLLLRNLLASTADTTLRTVLVTSPSAGEGKSTTAANLAISLAESGRRVLLVDADFHRPVQAKLFGLSNRKGLSTLLIDPELDVHAAVQPSRIADLQVLPSGPMPPDPSALLTSKRLRDRLDELGRGWDVVVLDTPPLLGQPDAAFLGSHSDIALLVLDAQKSRGRRAARAVEMLEAAGASVVGAVLNGLPRGSTEYDQYGYASTSTSTSTTPSPSGQADLATVPEPLAFG